MTWDGSQMPHLTGGLCKQLLCPDHCKNQTYARGFYRVKNSLVKCVSLDTCPFLRLSIEELASVCDVSCRLSPWISSLIIIANNCLVVLMEWKAILALIGIQITAALFVWCDDQLSGSNCYALWHYPFWFWRKWLPKILKLPNISDITPVGFLGSVWTVCVFVCLCHSSAPKGGLSVSKVGQCVRLNYSILLRESNIFLGQSALPENTSLYLFSYQT